MRYFIVFIVALAACGGKVTPSPLLGTYGATGQVDFYCLDQPGSNQTFDERITISEPKDLSNGDLQFQPFSDFNCQIPLISSDNGNYAVLSGPATCTDGSGINSAPTYTYQQVSLSNQTDRTTGMRYVTMNFIMVDSDANAPGCFVQGSLTLTPVVTL